MKRSKKRRAAARKGAPAWARHVATTKWSAQAEAKQRYNQGTFGAASAAVSIDPKTGERRAIEPVPTLRKKPDKAKQCDDRAERKRARGNIRHDWTIALQGAGYSVRKLAARPAHFRLTIPGIDDVWFDFWPLTGTWGGASCGYHRKAGLFAFLNYLDTFQAQWGPPK
jgi:hypothetical protein